MKDKDTPRQSETAAPPESSLDRRSFVRAAYTVPTLTMLGLASQSAYGTGPIGPPSGLGAPEAPAPNE